MPPNQAASPQARLCAGWVGCHGTDLLALRLALCGGTLEAPVLDYRSPLPLFASGAAAAAHGRRDLHQPGLVAQRLMDKIRIQRQDVTE